jgi:hypothetical protein
VTRAKNIRHPANPQLTTPVTMRCRDPPYRALFSLFAKTMRAKGGHLEDGGAELGK